MKLETIDVENPKNKAEEHLVHSILNNESSNFIKGMMEAFYAVGMIDDRQHSELASIVFEMTLQGR